MEKKKKEIKLLESSGLTEFNEIFRRRRRNVIWYLSKIEAIKKDIARLKLDKKPGYVSRIPLLRCKIVELEKKLLHIRIIRRRKNLISANNRRKEELRTKTYFRVDTIIKLLKLRSFKQIGYTSIEEVMNSNLLIAIRKVRKTFSHLRLTNNLCRAIIRSIDDKNKKILGKTYVYPSK